MKPTLFALAIFVCFAGPVLASGLSIDKKDINCQFGGWDNNVKLQIDVSKNGTEEREFFCLDNGCKTPFEVKISRCGFSSTDKYTCRLGGQFTNLVIDLKSATFVNGTPSKLRIKSQITENTLFGNSKKVITCTVDQ